MSLPPINGERASASRPAGSNKSRGNGAVSRNAASQKPPPSSSLSASPPLFDDDETTDDFAGTSGTGSATDRRDASDFRILVATRIRPFTEREVRQWRQERRTAEAHDVDAEEARRARAGLRQPFGPDHMLLNATQQGLDGTWTMRRHDDSVNHRHSNSSNNNGDGDGGGVGSVDASSNRGSFDALDMPPPVVEVESDGKTVILLDVQSRGNDGANDASPVRSAFTYDFVFSSFAPNVELDAQLVDPGLTGRRGGEARTTSYVIMDRDDAEDTAIAHGSSSHTPAQEQQAEEEQVAIYEQLAIPLVNAALHGYNTCMFAYGQTGSGKTYTMMGTPRHPGLIPRLCRLLFSEVAARNDADAAGSASGTSCPASIVLQLSYMEIYNEQVRDLLKQRPKNAILHYKSRFDKKDVDSDEYRMLKVRHHPSKGIYVDGLTSLPVRTWDECEVYLQQGNAFRTQCSTVMNANSSRSHAIFQLQMTQRESTGGRVRGREVALETFSKINLVDLAGSERNTHAKTTGKHLAEANSINASLSTLRRVLDGLIANRALALSSDNAKAASKSTGRHSKGRKGGGAVIPYRESLLTYVLSDNLGGNSFTVMCANVSPCAANAGETESTLRYATLAQNVINHAKRNASPTARVMHEMRDQLRVMQEALRRAPDPSRVAALEEGVHLSEELLREMKSREETYEAQLQEQAAQATALRRAVEEHCQQEAYWRAEAQRQQREVEELREALFEATQNGGSGSGEVVPAKNKKLYRQQLDQKKSPPSCEREGESDGEAPLSPASRDWKPTRARGTPLSLMGLRGEQHRPSRTSLPTLLTGMPASAPTKTLASGGARRASRSTASYNSNNATPTAALAPRPSLSKSPGPTKRRSSPRAKSVGTAEPSGASGRSGDDVLPVIAEGEGEGEEEEEVPSVYHTEQYLTHAADAAESSSDSEVHEPSNSQQLQLAQAYRSGPFGDGGSNNGGLAIEGVAATPSQHGSTPSLRVAAARQAQAARDRRRSSTIAAAAAKRTRKAAGREVKADALVVPSREPVAEAGQAWLPHKIAMSADNVGVENDAAENRDHFPALKYVDEPADANDSEEGGNPTPRASRSPHGDEGLTDVHSTNAEDHEEEEDDDEDEDEDEEDAAAAALSSCSNSNHPQVNGLCADDTDSVAASFSQSGKTAAAEMTQQFLKKKKTPQSNAHRQRSESDVANERHYSMVDTLH